MAVKDKKTKDEKEKLYYTQRRENLKKIVEKVKNGELQIEKPADAMVLAGYTRGSATTILNDPIKNKAIAQLVSEIWPLEEAFQEVKEIHTLAKGEKQYGAALKAIELRGRIAGDYAAEKRQLEVSGSVHHEHDLTLGSTDYLEYKLSKRDKKEIVEGEIVNSSE